ncbi:MAG: hypothetical protein ACRDYF_06820, partial [Acidimicrobiia bacterium]
SVIVEPPVAEATSTPAPTGVALPPARPASDGDSGSSAAVLIAAVGGGVLAAGLAAWALQMRSRRQPQS